MPKPLLMLLGIISIGVGVWGLVSGKVIAGSRGLQSNFYTKQDSPLLYYSFIFIYFAVGFLVLSQTL
ncbi:hypothetical protein FE848_14650 [Marinobacter sp. 1-3A]|uniref:hypothetical protein n=1 Tax=Marinobacter TaxID=2742 RepID=UPI000C28A4D5|nr:MULTISPECIES: hypothetical protein [Marinobacter]MBK1874462.1 hypothetical protein [Marinobacter sp. 1-3A]